MSRLRQEIRALETHKSSTVVQSRSVDLGPINDAFPDRCFPLSVIHEFSCLQLENLAATQGFIASILGCLMKAGGAGVWIGATKSMIPTALLHYGIKPDHILFIDAHTDKEVLMIMEEVLKCAAFTGVVGQLRDLNLTSSRRLQLAVEQTKVTGFVVRYQPSASVATASYCKWQITTLPSYRESGKPGVGFFHWQVTLEKTRYGKTGSWPVAWKRKQFVATASPAAALPSIHRKAG